MKSTLTAGDSLFFPVAAGPYPASAGWVLKYRLLPATAGGTPVEFTAGVDPNGEDYLVALSATTTAGWAPDRYSWTRWVEKGGPTGEVYTVEAGLVEITPDPRQVAAGHEGRTQAEKALDEARAAFAAFSPTRRRYRVGGREMEFASAAEILVQIRFWEGEVERERQTARVAAGKPGGGMFYIRMGGR